MTTRAPLPDASAIAALPSDGGTEFNRLIFETSPYLLQHARNPVDWYPWGDEAFDRARAEAKPVFLSVGYSTCHWCHVMEHESFEHDSVAALLAARYIAIKVDREERPDIDEIYMAATQLLTGRGGWPMSVWLTPDREPFYAGTYYPREDRIGWQPGQGQTRSPGFKTILTHFADYFASSPEEIADHVRRLTDGVRQHVARDSSGDGSSGDIVVGVLDALRARFDATLGGFGGRPKFPPHGSLRLLLWRHRETGDPEALQMAVATLRAMARGGVHDHIGGGFHRYSTDDRWFLPHFEKMLYDNAQLLRVYAEAHDATGDADLRDVAERLVRWLSRDMRDEAGGFHSALDADSDGEEGTFYVWTPGQITEVLGDVDGARFNALYDIHSGGNWTEEATGERMKTCIPHLGADPAAATAPGPTGADLDALRERLYTVRATRVWPHLDDKVLTSWNALMLGALARAGDLLARPDWVEVAGEVARFLLGSMRDSDGNLLASFRAGSARLNAYLDDHAFLADALLDLHAATADETWLASAMELTEAMVTRFADPQGGFYFTSADHESLLVRSKNAIDKAIPSGNGVAAQVLVRLHLLTGDARWRTLAESTIAAFAGLASQFPLAAQSLALASGVLQASTSAPGPLARHAPVSVFAEEADSPGAIRLRLAIDPGWHIQSASPAHDWLTATSLEAPAGALGAVDWPAGETVAVGGDALDVYSGDTVVMVAFDRSAGVELKLSFQACDDRSCQQPVDLRFTV